MGTDGTEESPEVVLVSSGHPALDQRVFYKEAVSLAAAFPRVRVVAAYGRDEERDGVRITALPAVRWRPWRFLVQPLRCFRAARGAGARVLILQDAELVFWAPLVRAVTGWRMVYDVHEDFPQLMRQRRWIPGLLRGAVGWIIDRLEQRASRACAAVTAATQTLVEHFPHAVRASLYNLPSRAFVDEAETMTRPPGLREYDVAHVGTLSEARLEFLCAVLDALFARRAGARALVIGVRPDQHGYLCGRYPDTQVHVLPKVPYARVAEYLGNARVGLNIHPVLHRHLECAVPVKVFEYLAAGCAVVTSHLPELARLLGDDGAVAVTTLRSDDPAAYAGALDELLADPRGLAERGAAGMRLVRERLNWESEAEKLIALVRAVAEDRDAAASQEEICQST